MRRTIHLASALAGSLSNLSVYFTAALIPMLLSLVSNPFLAKCLSPVDYSIVGYYTAFSTLFTPLVTFYLLNYYTKRYFELDAAGRAVLKATLFRALVSFSFVMALVSFVALYVYGRWFNSGSRMPFLPYAVLSVGTLPLTGIYTLSLAECRMARRSRRFFRLSVGNGLLGTALALLFVVALGWGAFGRLLATFVAALAVFVYVLARERDVWRHPFDRRTFVSSLAFCLPLVAAAMLGFFSNGYDRVVLERGGDLHTLGIYSVGFTIAMYMSVFSNSINDTFQPDIFESIVRRDFRRCARFVALKLALMSLLVALFIVASPLIVDILTFGRYGASVPYAAVISLSSLTSMLYYSMSQVTIAMGYTFVTLSNKIVGSVLSVVSFAFLIGRFGAMGAAWGVVLSYVYFFVGNVVMVGIVYKVKRKKA